MKQIKIKNFGPIKSGFDGYNGYIKIHPVTVLCGNQGTGKSTIAKLVSTFSWLEKVLVRGYYKENEITKYNRFRKKHCAYHNIHNYFNENTYLEYTGEAYKFIYDNGGLTIEKTGMDNNYLMPQILYVPAERNFMSAIEDAEKIKNLPGALATMLDEFVKAKKNLSSGLSLPFEGYAFHFDRSNRISWITGKDFKIRLHEAASGFQSAIPLILVSRYLLKKVQGKKESNLDRLSAEDKEKMDKAIVSILSDKSIDDEVRKSLIARLNTMINYSCFINIIEEPEQNLFPSSQRHLLNELLAIFNSRPGNELLITTHSPYLLNYLTLAVKAHEIKLCGKKNINEVLKSIVPLESCVSSKSVAFYQITDSGSISILEKYEGLPSDSNYLNMHLDETNKLFDQLLDLEEKCRS